MNVMNLLLVEDDPDSAEAIESLLTLEGIQVDVAASGRDALARYERDPHYHADLILLDLMLPDMEGVELIRRIGAIREVPPVVIHSAVPAPQAAAAGRRIGALAVLRKPHDWPKMRGILEAVAAARNTLDR